MDNETKIYETRLDQVKDQVGEPEQWERVRKALSTHGTSGQAKAQAAIRNAAQCGTDPSWYGF